MTADEIVVVHIDPVKVQLMYTYPEEVNVLVQALSEGHMIIVYAVSIVLSYVKLVIPALVKLLTQGIPPHSM